MHGESAASLIEVDALTYHYGREMALCGVGFQVRSGELLGLLGPNGGGKTTLFRLLSTLFEPQQGSVRIAGFELASQPARIRSCIGVVFQSGSLDIELSAEENLVHHGHLHGLRGRDLRGRVERSLGRFGLLEMRHRRVRTFSGGQRRRLELARGLLHDPSILLLDEPTTGLDPAARRDFWEYLADLRREEEVTILLTTHLLEEAERCDRLLFLSAGRVVAEGPPDRLKERIGGDVITVRTRSGAELARRIQQETGLKAVPQEGGLRLEEKRGHEVAARLRERYGQEIDSITVGRPTLEDVFFHETGERL